MSRINETRHIIWHKTCKCICKYKSICICASVCNNRQSWNEDKCRCECKELADKGICNKGFICKCECDESCGIVKYLDYKNCV